MEKFMKPNWPAEAIILHLSHTSTVLPNKAVFLLNDETLAHEDANRHWIKAKVSEINDCRT